MRLAILTCLLAPLGCAVQSTTPDFTLPSQDAPPDAGPVVDVAPIVPTDAAPTVDVLDAGPSVPEAAPALAFDAGTADVAVVDASPAPAQDAETEAAAPPSPCIGSIVGDAGETCLQVNTVTVLQGSAYTACFTCAVLPAGRPSCWQVPSSAFLGCAGGLPPGTNFLWCCA